MATFNPEDLMNMEGGIDASQISENPTPSLAIPAEPIMENQNLIQENLSTSIENFIDNSSEINTGNAKVVFPDAVNQQINNPGQKLYTSPTNINATPIDRFKAFINNEKTINPRFDISKDLDDMIDYIIEQENLEKKFKRFTTNPEIQPEEERYTF